MKTILNMFLCPFFLMLACDRVEINCDPNDEESPCYIGVNPRAKLLLAAYQIDGKIRAKYEYDGLNRMITHELYNENGINEGVLTYSYNNRGLMWREVYAVPSSNYEMHKSYVYGEDDRPVSMMESDPNDPNTTIVDWQFEYSDNEVVEKGISRDEEPSIWVNTYVFNDGNLQSIAWELNGERYRTTEMDDYDDKNSSAKYGHPFHWRFPGPNNYRTFKQTAPHTAGNIDHIFKYTYNKEGYPVKAEVYDGESDVLVETRTYSYQPAQ